MSVGSLAISIRLPPGQEAANLDTTSSKVVPLKPDPEATSAARAGAGVRIAISSIGILAGSTGRTAGGGGAREVFVAEVVFFWADLPDPRALAALASNAGILKRDGGVD